jgi:hypothetical protein
MTKLAIKLSVIFLLLTILLYASSSISEVSSMQSVESSSESFAYPPLSSGGTLLGNNKVYLPFAMKNYFVPHATTSYYLNTINSNKLAQEGCNLANEVKGINGKQESVAILNFCQPWRNSSGVYGVNLCDLGGFASISSVESATKAFASNFYNCSTGYPDTLVVVVGTNNFGYYVNSTHGTEWAKMIDRINTWLQDPSRNYFYRVQAVGGSDMEISYNPYSTTSAWVNGYESQNSFPLYDFGDAEGCPAERSNYDRICQGMNYDWYQSQVWDISYKSSREALPLIYTNSGINAKQ